MSSLTGLGIGLSFLFGCFLLCLAAELYYILWWKKRFFQKREDLEIQNFSSSNYTPTDPSYVSCCNNPNSSKIPKTNEKDLQNSMGESEKSELQQESLDLELMRLHNLCGPPRFLFTINEETKEDLESERSRRGSRTRSLSDLLVTLDTSPLHSPPLKLNLEAFHHHGLNPLFESNEIEITNIGSSPPPTFKFLRDAEEKLLRRLMEFEAEKRAFMEKDQDFSRKTEEKDGSSVNFVISEGKCGKGIRPLNHQISTSSQVLPLASSPSSPIDKK